MTAYELASLHSQISDNLNAQLTNWLAILSVYLGAGFLIAHRLTLLSAVAVSGIFVLLLGSYANVMFRSLRGLMGLVLQIRKFAEQGAGLEWHEALLMPAFSIDMFPIASLIMMWLGIIGAIYFFFSSRHQNLKTATPV